MKTSGNILFCGVGGQGILLASELTAQAVLAAGFDARKSEVHGMAQRGGSVEAHLRYGDKVHSPLIEPGRADVLAAFEVMEAGRYLPYLRKEGVIVVNTQKIPPPAVALGERPYPDDILTRIQACGVRVAAIDAFAAAKDAGEIRSVNVVMVGALSVFLELDEALFLDAIDRTVKPAFREANKKAFLAGRTAIRA